MSDTAPKPLTLLYVDGDADARDRLSAALSSEGVSVESVASVADAVERLDGEDGEFDCIVGAKPDDGECIDLLRAVPEREHDLPLVLYPPSGSDRLASEATVASVTGYLPQSLDDETFDALLDRVRTTVRNGERAHEQRLDSLMFQSLLADFPISLYFKDTEARHVRASAEAGPTDSRELIGKTDVELYGHEIGEKAVESYEEDLHVIETGEPIVGDVYPHDVEVDGETYQIWLETTKLPWHDEAGEIEGLIGSTRDVTQQKERELELQQQAERLDRFASFVSHDLRNPLNLAQGYLDLAIETGDEHALGEVADALDRMSDLIDDLLTAAREEESEPTLEALSIAEVISKAWKAVESEDARLDVAVPAETVVWADRGRLLQVFENLFRNAIDHVGADVGVRVGVTETGFYVEDDGPGIPPEERESALSYGYTTSDSGTGMGLPIVTQIAEAHGWSVAIDEGSTGGARVCVDGPLHVTDPAPLVDGGDPFEADGNRDLGDPVTAGGATYDESDDAWVARGAGENVWLDVEEAHVVYQAVEGDVQLRGRVCALEPVDEYAKAGLVVRGGTEVGDPFGFVGVTPEHGTEVLWRFEPDGDVTSFQLDDDEPLPRWYRIDRVGETVTSYCSADGTEWTPVDQRTVPMPETVSVGLFVCSHLPGVTCEARFEDVTVTPLD